MIHHQAAHILLVDDICVGLNATIDTTCSRGGCTSDINPSSEAEWKRCG